jgi:hypothetical protein
VAGSRWVASLTIGMFFIFYILIFLYFILFTRTTTTTMNGCHHQHHILSPSSDPRRVCVSILKVFFLFIFSIYSYFCAERGRAATTITKRTPFQHQPTLASARRNGGSSNSNTSANARSRSLSCFWQRSVFNFMDDSRCLLPGSKMIGAFNAKLLENSFYLLDLVGV